MFDQIFFTQVQLPTPVTPAEIERQMSRNVQNLQEKENGTQEELPANMRNADYFIFGKMDTFSRPPVTDFALENLFYMEAFSIFTCPKGFFTNRKDYQSFLIIYTYEGNGGLEYMGKNYSLGPGDGFFIDCRVPHLYRTEGNVWKHGVFHLNGPLVPALFSRYMENGSVSFYQPFTGNYQKKLEELLSIYGSVQPCRDWLASDCISSILTDLLRNASEEKETDSPVPENLRYLIAYMEKHFTQTLTLDFLSRFSGISKYYLSREFKKYTGYSPNDYLISLRVEHAKFLLRSTTLPANKIALTAGFHDINNFTNLFRKKTGMTPGGYRKNC